MDERSKGAVMRFLGFGKRDKNEPEEPATPRKRDLQDVVNRTLARLAEEGSQSSAPPPPPPPAKLVEKGPPDQPAGQPVELRPDEPGVDAALAIVSRAIGADVQFEMASIFPPDLWADPVIAHELNATAIRPDIVGNRMGLLCDAELARRLRKSPDDPIRAALLAAGLGLAPFDENRQGGFASGKTEFLRAELRNIAASGASKEARELAVYNLHDWTAKLMRGEIEVEFPGM
jgi:hypothetical protein